MGQSKNEGAKMDQRSRVDHLRALCALEMLTHLDTKESPSAIRGVVSPPLIIVMMMRTVLLRAASARADRAERRAEAFSGVN